MVCYFGTYLAINLQASGSGTASVFSTQSWGAIIAPFIIGLIADRYFNEKILGLLHIWSLTDVSNVSFRGSRYVLHLCFFRLYDFTLLHWH
jgi:hypothetical protein